MAEVAIEMADIQTVLNSNPAFSQAGQGAALARRVDEVEAEKAATPVCTAKCCGQDPQGELEFVED
jgi:hypothetical protein